MRLTNRINDVKQIECNVSQWFGSQIQMVIGPCRITKTKCIVLQIATNFPEKKKIQNKKKTRFFPQLLKWR